MSNFICAYLRQNLLKMSKDPFLVEYARSSRSTCKGCLKLIQKNTLRIARVFKSILFDGDQLNWFHQPCFFKYHRPSMWMEDATVTNLIFSHPEDRNAHNTVFGGFLMRHALELSYALAHRICPQRPELLHISDISFNRSVAVSSFIEMNAHVIYTEKNYLQIVVMAKIMDQDPGNKYVLTTQAAGWELLTKLWTEPEDKIVELWSQTADTYLTQSTK